MNPILIIEWEERDMVAEAEEKPQAAKKEEQQKRSYWSKDGQVFFTGGYGWGLRLAETASTDGRRCYDVKHVCLGKEEDVLAMLDDEPVPDTLPRVQREILTKMLESVRKNKRSSRHNDRTQRFSFRERAGRGFRGNYRYGL